MKKWTREELRLLHKYVAENLTAKQIAERLNRTYQSVKKKANYLNLEPNVRMYKPKPYTRTQKYMTKLEKWCDVLQKHWNGTLDISYFERG